MQIVRILLMILFVPLFLQACGKSKGEKFAEETCDCYEKAQSNNMQKLTCMTKQAQLQTEILGDAGETVKFLEKFSQCKAAK